MAVHTVDPSTRETEAGRSLEFDRGQPGLQRKFLDSQGYTEKPCVKKTKIKPKKKKIDLQFESQPYSQRFNLSPAWRYLPITQTMAGQTRKSMSLKTIMCTGAHTEDLMEVRQALSQLNFILCPIFSTLF